MNDSPTEPTVKGMKTTLRQVLKTGLEHRDELTTFTKRDFASAHPEFQKLLMGTQIETNDTKMQDEAHRREIFGHKHWGKALTKMANLYLGKHDIQTGDLPGLIDFTSMIVPPLVPELIGRELMPIKPVTEPVTRFPVFEKGKSSKTARGLNDYRSTSGKMVYKDLKLQNSWSTSDKVDLDFLEDIQPAMINEYWSELYRAHRELVSLNFIKAITGATYNGSGGPKDTGSWTDASGNTHKRSKLSDSGESGLGTAFTFAKLIGEVMGQRKVNINPNCMLTSWTVMGTFLIDDQFMSNDYFREYANYNKGMIDSLLGMNIYVSTQLAEAEGGTSEETAYLFPKERFLCAAIRRDELVTNIRDDNTLEQGLGISSRYGFAAKDGSTALKWQL